MPRVQHCKQIPVNPLQELNLYKKKVKSSSNT